jgi:hypothetical protein
MLAARSVGALLLMVVHRSFRRADVCVPGVVPTALYSSELTGSQSEQQ